jgi:uncharacterized protein DUF5993
MGLRRRQAAFEEACSRKLKAVSMIAPSAGDWCCAERESDLHWTGHFPRWHRAMEFTALFLALVVVMAACWWGPRRLALALFAVALIASVATYLHHATDVLKLSF